MSRFDTATMIALANRAITRIDSQGPRGTTMVTYEEIEAMACLITALRHAMLDEFTKEQRTHHEQ